MGAIACCFICTDKTVVFATAEHAEGKDYVIITETYKIMQLQKKDAEKKS